MQEERLDISEQDRVKVTKFFNNPSIGNLLKKEIMLLYQDQEVISNFTFAITIEGLHLYIYITRSQTYKSDTTDSEQENHHNWMNTAYTIRIGKNFPIAGVRIYTLSNPFQPRIFDGRDLMYEIIGDVWTPKCHLIQIVKGLDRFEKKLENRNEKYLPMQKTGQFQLGDIFTIEQLKKFPSHEIFKDLSSEDGVIIATSETHFLTYKAVIQEGSIEKYRKIYQLKRACDLQCINQIHHNSLQNEIVLTLFKYRSIKTFNEYEKVRRVYRLENSELFLRNVLKFITKFQKIEINLETAVHWKRENDFDQLNKRIQECKQLESAYQNHYEYETRETVFSRLGKNYQRLIEYFSARASCYYLIYVNKLNNLYASKES